MWMALTLLACQEPFGTDRHDLVGFRVAAVSVPPAAPGDPTVPRAAVIVDGRPWAPSPADLRWYWVSDPGAVVALDPDTDTPDGVGAAPALVRPEDRPVLALVASADGEQERAFVAVPAPPADLAPIDRLDVGTLPLDVARVTAEALQLDARRRLDPGADPLEPGGFARLRAEVSGDPLVRWMATAGTFFELDRQTADWAAGDLRLDGDQIDEDVPRKAIAPQWVTVVALALDGRGETTFTAGDLPVGVDGPGLWLDGRFLPTDAEVPFGQGEQVRGTLLADDESPVGVVLVGGAAEPVGTPSPPLPCDPPLDGPFHPAVLLEQRCGRDALDGAEVVVVPGGVR